MQDGILDPVFFQLFHGKPLEQLFFALKVSLERRYEQTFTKAARTAQEIVATGFDNTVDQFGFINVEITATAKLFKVLYSDRINLVAHNCPFCCLPE